MPQQIDQSLDLLDKWYIESNNDSDKVELLSKLALLELCGWIEVTFDDLIKHIDNRTLNDPDWVNENLIKSTYGFSYKQHFRPMLVRLIGEISTRKIEKEMEINHSGDLDQMKSLLGTLWDKRCKLAHADVAANVASQVHFDAPSWSKRQYTSLNALFSTLKNSIDIILNDI